MFLVKCKQQYERNFDNKLLNETHTHNHFNGLWSGTTRVGRYQKKHSSTHTHPDHRTFFMLNEINRKIRQIKMQRIFYVRKSQN